MKASPGEAAREDEEEQGSSAGEDSPGLVSSAGETPAGQGEIIVGQAHFSGPLPHPQLMAGYEEALPGSAERILKMSEEAQQHRHSMEKASLQGVMRHDVLGWASSTLITILVLIGSFWLISQGQSIYGVAGIIVATVALAATFLRSQRRAAKP